MGNRPKTHRHQASRCPAFASAWTASARIQKNLVASRTRMAREFTIDDDEAFTSTTPWTCAPATRRVQPPT